MDSMLKASSLLLLALVLHVQLSSSLPMFIDAKVVLSSVAAEEQGAEELAPVTEDHSHFLEEKGSVQEKLIPTVAGEVAQSTEDSPPEENIPVNSKELELVSNGDRSYNNADEDLSQELAHQEPLPGAPQDSSEEDNAPVEAAFAESSPDDTTEEVAPPFGVESESPEQHYVEVPAPVESIPLISVGTSEDKTTDGNADEAAIEEILLSVPDDDTKIEENPLPSTPEKLIDLVPAEHETQEAGQWEPTARELAPEVLSPNVIYSAEQDEQQPGQMRQEETVIILVEAKEEQAHEKNGKEEQEGDPPVVVKENTKVDLAKKEQLFHLTLDKEETVARFPIVLDGQVEPTAEEKATQEPMVEYSAVISQLYLIEEKPEQEEQSIKESAPEDPVVPVPMYPVEEELEHEEQIEEQSIEESAPQDPIVIVPLYPAEEELEKEEQVEEESINESVTEDPVVIVNLCPAEEEPEPRKQVEEESIHNPEQHTEVTWVPAHVVTDKNAEQGLDINEDHLTYTPKEEESFVIVHVELDTKDRSQEEPVADETALEKPTPIILVVPTSKEPAPEAPMLIISQENLEENVSKDITGYYFLQLDALRKEAALEDDIAQEDEVGGTDAEILVTSETEPTEKVLNQALVNRGAVLGAALFMLMSFITIGFVWTTVSKKLH